MQTEQIWNSLSCTIVWKKFSDRELEKKQQQEFDAKDWYKGLRKSYFILEVTVSEKKAL